MAGNHHCDFLCTGFGDFVVGEAVADLHHKKTRKPVKLHKQSLARAVESSVSRTPPTAAK